MDALAPLATVPSLSDRAHEVIKEAILSLKIGPGEVVAIGRLADWLGVSRTPVRDALLRLEKEGLVIVLPQKGACVADISRKDVQDIYELLILLEGYAARAAACCFTAEDDALAAASLDAGRAAHERGDHVEASDLGRRLHDLIVAKVNNPRLSAYYLDNLTVHYTRIRRFASTLPGRYELSHAQHIEILEALRTRDPQRAGEAMTRHQSSVRSDILANLDGWLKDLNARQELG